MDHHVEIGERGAVVALSGEVDLEQSPRAREVLLRSVAGHAAVLVDLSAVEYIDSSGVASLVEALQAAKKRGSAFGLVSLSGPARRVLELGRLDRVFPIFENAEAGLDGLA
ncbi:MAG: STAS domain-containing protein [Myxococcota bacterium]